MNITIKIDGLALRKILGVLILLLLVGSVGLNASSISDYGLYTFSSGSTISSSEVNYNFSELERRIAHRNFSAIVDSSGYGTHTSIKAAIADIDAGTVLITQGTYQLDGDNCEIDVPQGVNILGEGYDTVIELTDISCANVFNMLGYNVVSNLRFIGIATSNGNGVSVSGDYVTVRDCWFSKGMRGVYAYGAEHLRVLDNTIANMDEHGVLLSHGSNYGVIRGNKFSGGKRGVYLLEVQGSIVTGNYFSQHSARGVFVNRGSTDNVIANNVFIDMTASSSANAISIENDTPDNKEGSSVRNTIVGNVINMTSSSCIRLASAEAYPTEHTVIVGNVLYECGTHGVTGDDTTMHTTAVGNVINLVDESPFHFNGSIGASIAGNVINDTGDGTVLYGELFTYGSNVSNNGGHNGTKDGLRLVGAELAAAVTGNAFKDQTRHGIYAHSDSKYVAISGNTSVENANTDIKTASGSTDCTVVSNVTSNGIEQSGSCAYGYNQ